MRRASRFLSVLVWSIPALALSACGRAELPAGYRVGADLAAELPVATVHREVGAIDVGAPEARPHLGSGWSWDERGPDGETFAWGIGTASEVRFELMAPRELELRLRGRPFALPVDGSGTVQTVDVALNGRPVGRLELERGIGSHALVLPEGATVPGENRLTLRYGRARSPREAGLSDDRRSLAVAWSGFRLSPMQAEAPRPTAAVEPGGEGNGKRSPRLRLPFGTGVDYFLEVPDPRSRSESGAGSGPGIGPGAPQRGPILALEALRADGDGALRVEIQEEGEETTIAGRVGPAEGRRVLRLPIGSGAPGPRLVRVGLRAVAAAPGAEGALELVAPELAVPATGPPADSPQADPSDGAPAPRPTPARGANVLIYMVDTLRADRVGVYGGVGAARGLTPAVDAFAAGAVVFDDAVAQAPWTRPAVATLLTGLRPLRHGVTTLDDRLADDALTLPEILGREGYRTAAFSTNWHVTEATGMAQGFDDFVFTPDDFHADAVNRRVVEWLDGLGSGHGSGERSGAPFFLYVHTLDPHAPYDPPAPFRERFAPEAPPGAGSRDHLERIYAAGAAGRREERRRLLEPIPALYDGEVAYTDRAFGELLAALRERGLAEQTLVVFVADHGEGLDEHGHLGHGDDLHREVLRIPWILRLPPEAGEAEDEAPQGAPGRRVAGTARQIDLLPTMLAALGIEPPTGLPGADLLAEGAPAERPAFSHLDYEGRRAVSVVLGGWKAIEPLSVAFGREPELYHRARDPGERRNVAQEHPVRLGYLRTLIRRHLVETGEGSLAASAELDEEARRGLEALGYL